MNVDSVRLINFRNYDEQDVEFYNGINVFVGPNGHGKSNILESIYLLLSGKSFRLNSNADLIQKSKEQSQITGKISSKSTRNDVHISITKTGTEIELNSKRGGRTKIQNQFCGVIFSPESLSIIKDGPAARRNFTDELLISLAPEKSKDLLDFQRCLRTRNRVLKSYLNEEILKSEAEDIVKSLELSYLELATKVTMGRLQVLRHLALRAKTSFREIFSPEDVDISVDYLISQQSAFAWSQNQVYDALTSRLEELERAEWAAGQSLVGPHRHDIRFNLNGSDLRIFGSQGQQRAVVLAFKLAQIGSYFELRGEYPVLLLDDVMSELDLEKQKALLAILGNLPAQIFMATTDIEKEYVKGIGNNLEIFEIFRGKVQSGWK